MIRIETLCRFCLKLIGSVFCGNLAVFARVLVVMIFTHTVRLRQHERLSWPQALFRLGYLPVINVQHSMIYLFLYLKITAIFYSFEGVCSCYTGTLRKVDK